MTWDRRKGRAPKYRTAHQRARAAAAARHQPTDPCARCGHPLGPMGPGLHYDHAEDGSYLGFSHGSPCPWCRRPCNKRAGAIKGSRIAHRRKLVTRLAW